MVLKFKAFGSFGEFPDLGLFKRTKEKEEEKEEEVYRPWWWNL